MQASSVLFRLSAAAALLVAPMLLGSRGCTPGSSHERCPDEAAPVCGVDGVTYDTRCDAEQAGVEVAYDGACGIACYELYAPVCGSDGVTYPNDCYAGAAGVEILHEGGCACLPVYCDIACPYGLLVDPTTGCAGCTCAPPPTPEPPAPSECDSDADCLEGQICAWSGGLCGCPPGTECECPSESVCVWETPPSACRSDADCSDSETCIVLEVDCAEADGDAGPGGCTIVGVCNPIIDPPPPPADCRSDADCGSGEYCAYTRCGCEDGGAPADDPSDAGVPLPPPDCGCAGVGVCLAGGI